jgi:DNA topoisomerase-3
VLAALERGGYREAVAAADPGRRSRAFDDKRISAHTAIVPTSNAAPTNGLSDQERALYDMVVRTYLAQFYPDQRYQATKVITECVGERFRSGGRRTLEVGWKVLFPAPKSAAGEGEAAEQTLPALREGGVICEQAEVLARQTRPPAHYTEGTLIRAMANIARLVDDERIRRTLRENQGIGTEATRAGIIETLKRRGFISVRGRSLLATPLGGALVDSAPAQLTSPAITAWWEQQLALIAEGDGELAVFEARAADWIRRLLPTIGRERFNAPLRAPGNRPPGRGAKSKRRPRAAPTSDRPAAGAKRRAPPA